MFSTGAGVETAFHTPRPTKQVEVTPMTTDLTNLAWISVLTALMSLPYTLVRIASYGLMPVLSYTVDNNPLPEWAARAKRAHYNAIENLAPFAAVVLVAHLTQSNNATTALWSSVYLWSRIAHYFGYMSGIAFLRTIFFGIGLLAILAIFYQIIT
jgi:uncharacterized MAPEG superfamily protein